MGECCKKFKFLLKLLAEYRPVKYIMHFVSKNNQGWAIIKVIDGRIQF